MKHIIQFTIYKREKHHIGEHYIGEGINLPIVTQGKTLDEAIANTKEALSLRLEGENLEEFDLDRNSPILINFELRPLYA